MKISVIVPTYNRLSILKKCLKAISMQNFPINDFEVIVVDDGSNDGTEKLKEELFKDYIFNAKYFFQNNKGPSTARNMGILNAKGDILVFIGDDIIIGKDFLQTHFDAHIKSDSIALIGQTLWNEEEKVTPFMKILENGIQFDFKNLDNSNVSFKNCYTSNISVNRNFIINNSLLFSEEFPYAAFEDIEWGFRLMKNGVIFLYEKNAIGYHEHFVDMKGYSQRMIYSGRALAYLLNIHKDIPFRKRCPKKGLKYFELFIRSKIREFFLHLPLTMNLMYKFFPKAFEKSIKVILNYYEEKGFSEEYAKILAKQ